MNTEKATALAQEALGYINREMDVHVHNEKNVYQRTVKCRFVSWGSVSISENGGEPSFQLTARVEEIQNKDKIYYPSLESVVQYFKKIDSAV